MHLPQNGIPLVLNHSHLAKLQAKSPARAGSLQESTEVQESVGGPLHGGAFLVVRKEGSGTCLDLPHSRILLFQETIKHPGETAGF